MRLLVTGGAGFIGSHFVRKTLRADPDAPVTVLDRLTYAGNPANLDPVRSAPGFAFVTGDVSDAPLVDQLLAEHDAVLHFAAESHVDRSIQGARDFVLSNVVGTQTLLEAAHQHQVRRFVHVSTDEVYGSIPIGSWPESDPLRPHSPYAASKAASDLLALSYQHTHELPVVVTRCSNNYGPYQHPEKMIPLFVTTLLDGGMVPLYGDGSNVRDWLHVDDHCHALNLVLRHGRAGEVYNIGGGTELSNRELTSRLLAACGADWNQVRHVPDRPGHDQRYSVDCRKIHDELGYSPRHTLDEGLAETVAWYRDNRAWWQPPRAGETGEAR